MGYKFRKPYPGYGIPFIKNSIFLSFFRNSKFISLFCIQNFYSFSIFLSPFQSTSKISGPSFYTVIQIYHFLIPNYPKYLKISTLPGPDVKFWTRTRRGPAKISTRTRRGPAKFLKRTTRTRNSESRSTRTPPLGGSGQHWAPQYELQKILGYNRYCMVRL